MSDHPSLLQDESGEWTAADAEHWIGVYRQLVEFCQEALAGAELGEAVAMRRRLRQFEARLAFWSQAEPPPGITKP
jgi:hypothetical protein